MRQLAFFLCALSVSAGAMAQPWAEKDDYRNFEINVSTEADAMTTQAAETFASYWEKCIGAQGEQEKPGDAYRVWIGQEHLPESLAEGLALDTLAEDGVVIATVTERDLVIAGGSSRGTLNAVYEFFEKYMGVRWLALDYTYIPESPPAELNRINYRYEPVFEYRYSTYLWMEGEEFQRYKQAHKWHEGPGFACHTFYRYVPPAQYFDEHPEYFSLIDGKRVAPKESSYEYARKHPEERGQLCMTNEDVIAIITERIREEARANPDNKYHHVSQMDWLSYCECGQCAAIDKREGSHMGSVLYALNRIADTIGKEFPGHGIETLAYQYTRKPPKHMKPRDNVAIKLCSIECDFSRPLNDPKSEENRMFADDIKKWSKIAKRLHVWNYNVNYRNFQGPYPNFHVLQPNEAFFAEHNVKGLFEQAAYDRAAEFAYLRAYVLSKLMWNPYQDTDAIIREFTDLYYEEAAPYIRQYLDLVEEQFSEKGHFLAFSDDSRWIDYEFVEQARVLFDKARNAGISEEVRKRVDQTGLTVEYCALICPPKVEISENTFTISRPPSLELDEYAALLKSYGAKVVVDLSPFEELFNQVGHRTPTRHRRSSLEKLENDRYEVWVTPAIDGTIMRWHDKKLGAELLRGYQDFGRYAGTWQEWVNTPGTPEHPAAEVYEVVDRTPTSLTVRAAQTDGLVLERTLSLDGGQVDYVLHMRNPTNVDIVPSAKVHPEFYAQGEHKPEIWIERPAGWELLNPDIPEEVRAAGRIIDPQGATRWAIRIPGARLTLLNEFDPDGIRNLLYFWSVQWQAQHVNLELLPSQEPIPPGGERVIRASYLATKKKPKKL